MIFLVISCEKPNEKVCIKPLFSEVFLEGVPGGGLGHLGRLGWVLNHHGCCDGTTSAQCSVAVWVL